MPSTLPIVDPTREPGILVRAIAAVAATSIGKSLSRLLFWKLDPILLRATGGRVGTSMVVRSALLETRGAKSGAVRRSAVVYFHDGDAVVIVASKAGAATHPAWYHNLRAHPDVTLNEVPMHATVVTDEAERTRLWGLADRVFPAFASYRRDAAKWERAIPLVRLTRR